jgi:hypothetical protein
MMLGGEQVVTEGRHVQRGRIASRFRSAMGRLAA